MEGPSELGSGSESEDDGKTLGPIIFRLRVLVRRGGGSSIVDEVDSEGLVGSDFDVLVGRFTRLYFIMSVMGPKKLKLK